MTTPTDAYTREPDDDTFDVLEHFPFNVHEHASPKLREYVELIPGVFVHFRSAYCMLFAARPDLATELSRLQRIEVDYPFDFTETPFRAHEFMSLVVYTLENAVSFRRKLALRAERDAARKGEGEAQAEGNPSQPEHHGASNP